MPFPALVRCGPSGWSFPDWHNVIYPRPRSKNFHPLEYLAHYFDLVEIDSSFHGPLRPEIARLWVRMVAHNAGFVFTARLGREFTHERSLGSDEVKVFKEGLWPLLNSGRLGCLLMEFPWAFRFNSGNRDFLIQLRRTFHEFPLAAEMRHSSWMVDEALGTLVDYRIGFVNIDQPQFPRAMPPTAIITSSIGYVRLHGRTTVDWFEDDACATLRLHNEKYLYSLTELSEWQERIERVAAFTKNTFVVATNHSGGKSAVNALQLGKLLHAASYSPVLERIA